MSGCLNQPTFFCVRPTNQPSGEIKRSLKWRKHGFWGPRSFERQQPPVKRTRIFESWQFSGSKPIRNSSVLEQSGDPCMETSVVRNILITSIGDKKLQQCNNHLIPSIFFFFVYACCLYLGSTNICPNRDPQLTKKICNTLLTS